MAQVKMFSYKLIKIMTLALLNLFIALSLLCIAYVPVWLPSVMVYKLTR